MKEEKIDRIGMDAKRIGTVKGKIGRRQTMIKGHMIKMIEEKKVKEIRETAKRGMIEIAEIIGREMREEMKEEIKRKKNTGRGRHEKVKNEEISDEARRKSLANVKTRERRDAETWTSRMQNQTDSRTNTVRNQREEGNKNRNTKRYLTDLASSDR